MSLAIRRATAADADALARVGASTFVDTFGHMYPQEDLQAFLDQSHSPDAYARYLADEAYALWLVEGDGDVVGYALAGPAGLPHPDLRVGDGEL